MKEIESADKRRRLKDIKNFAVYYGYGRVDELKRFNLVVLEPSGQNPANIKQLSHNGTLVLAYVSVMEISKSNKYYRFLKEEDFLQIDGKRVINKEFQTVLVDIRSRRWKALLMHNICNLLISEHYDGIFLDTMGDLEFKFIPVNIQSCLLYEAVNLVREIRNLYSDRIIIQNNGLNNLCFITSSFIDGLCCENLPIANKKHGKITEKIFKQLQYIQEKRNVKILLLFEKEGIVKSDNKKYNYQMENIVQKNHFVISYAPCNYLDLSFE